MTSAHRQIKVALDGVLFGYVWLVWVLINLRLQFGWRSSPGWWELAAEAVTHAHNSCTPESAPQPLQSAVDFAASVRVHLSPVGQVRAVVRRNHDA